MANANESSSTNSRARPTLEEIFFMLLSPLLAALRTQRVALDQLTNNEFRSTPRRGERLTGDAMA
jgi:hypothetical protein